MEFMLVTTGMVLFIVLVLVLLSRSYPGSGADLLDWKPTRDYETEIQLEQDDIAQMLAAQNEYRRKRGAGELTELDAERMAQEDNQVRNNSVPLDQQSLSEMERELLARKQRGAGRPDASADGPSAAAADPEGGDGGESPSRTDG